MRPSQSWVGVHFNVMTMSCRLSPLEVQVFIKRDRKCHYDDKKNTLNELSWRESEWQPLAAHREEWPSTDHLLHTSSSERKYLQVHSPVWSVTGCRGGGGTWNRLSWRQQTSTCLENCHGVVHRYQRLCFLRPLKNQNTLLFFVMCYEINRAPNPRGHHQYPSHLCKTALARTPRIDITLNLHVLFSDDNYERYNVWCIIWRERRRGNRSIFILFGHVTHQVKSFHNLTPRLYNNSIHISSRLEIAKRKSNCLELMTTAIFFLHAFTSDAFLMDCDYIEISFVSKIVKAAEDF